MRSPQAVVLHLSPQLQALLQRLLRRQTADQRLVRRASIILALAADPCVQTTARRLGLNRRTVRHWRDRWLLAVGAVSVLPYARRKQRLATARQVGRACSGG